MSEFGREGVRGASVGVIVVSAFGFVWATLGGSSAFPDLSLLVLVSAAVVSLALVFMGLYLRRAARSLSGSRGSMPASVGRRFGIVSVAEGAAIGAAVFAFSRVGRPEWIPAVVALIVGLHFFPLASIFRVRLYRVTGVLLCAVFALTVILAAASRAEAVWFAVPGLGSAAALWTTGAILAASGLSSIRRYHVETK